jgi:hypothetical protein
LTSTPATTPGIAGRSEAVDAEFGVLHQEDGEEVGDGAEQVFRRTLRHHCVRIDAVNQHDPTKARRIAAELATACVADIERRQRVGVSAGTRSKLTGHKTRAVFDRYNIVNERELMSAGEQLARYLEAESS